MKTRLCTRCRKRRGITRYRIQQYGLAGVCKDCQNIRKKEQRGKGTTNCSFNNAKARCNYKGYPGYYNYGGRGIKFLFKDIAELISEIGVRPTDTSLDRINSNGNYEKGNVRWSDRKEQNRNTRANKVSLEDVIKIREYSKKGFTNSQIAGIIGITTRMTWRIVRGETWYE